MKLYVVNRGQPLATGKAACILHNTSFSTLGEAVAAMNADVEKAKASKQFINMTQDKLWTFIEFADGTCVKWTIEDFVLPDGKRG